MVRGLVQQTLTMTDQVQTVQGLGAVAGGTVHVIQLISTLTDHLSCIICGDENAPQRIAINNYMYRRNAHQNNCVVN